MEIEHVARIGFAARRTAQQQGNLTVTPGLLGQVVVNDQGVLTTVAEVLAHGASGIRRDVLQRGGFGGGGGDDDGVLHGAMLFELAHDVGDGRCLLADGDVDAEEILALLVDDGVDGDGSLAGLAVADDQFALAAADGHHRVHALQTGLHRLRHGLTPDDARRDLFDLVGQLGVDRAFAIDRLTEGVDHATQQFGTDRHFQNTAGGLDHVAFGNVFVFAKNHGADGIALKVERHAEGVAGKFEHFALHDVLQAVHTADAIGDGNHGALRAHFRCALQVLDLALDQFRNFGRIQLHEILLVVQRHGHRVEFAAD